MVMYIILNVINVVLQTVKSLVTVKCGKVLASIINALAYGFYTVIIIYTALDGITLLAKCIIVGACNLVGVFVVKLVEEKLRKDRLWEIRVTCNKAKTYRIDKLLNDKNIPHNYIESVGKHTIFNIYCETQEQSAFVNEIIKMYNCKYFIGESKVF